MGHATHTGLIFSKENTRFGMISSRNEENEKLSESRKGPENAERQHSRGPERRKEGKTLKSDERISNEIDEVVDC